MIYFKKIKKALKVIEFQKKAILSLSKNRPIFEYLHKTGRNINRKGQYLMNMAGFVTF